MNIENVSIETIIPYARNPRKNDGSVDKVASSLQEFGWKQPIVVDKNMVVVVGHTRLKAPQKLGLKHVPVHVASDLTSAQIKAYRIADNRVGEEYEWDKELLYLEFEELKELDFDLLLTGFDVEDFPGLSPQGDGMDNCDKVPKVPVDPITKLGDLYILGDHRLLCGDSTVVTHVEKLMNGLKANLVFTDPPYGMSYGGGRFQKRKYITVKNFGVIMGDNKRGNDLIDLVKDALINASLVTNKESAYYVCLTWRTYSEFMDAMASANLKIDNCIVWNKKSIGLGNANYRPQHEFIFYKKGGDFFGGKDQSDVWEVSRGNLVNYVHPTQKPVELIEKAILNSSGNGDIVLDVFGGSGSTLIACENTGRCGMLMELDPKYCDVIVKRWEDFTGKKAERKLKERWAK